MDFKDFREGLLSLALLIFIFSLTFMIGSILLRPYINLEIEDQNFIIILNATNIIFSVYYFFEALSLEKIFKLEDKHIIKFGKRIGIITLFYMFHFFLMGSLLFRELHSLQNMMIISIMLLELSLLAVVLKEVYDLVFLEDSQRKLELDKNRRMYIKRERLHPKQSD
ncbi:MAG: hypothetical protein ACFFDK_11780 [Promethearchaeota archaeon]